MLTSVKLTVFFNEPFWIGIFEIQEGEYYKVSKVTFGAEPKDAEERKQYEMKKNKRKEKHKGH